MAESSKLQSSLGSPPGRASGSGFHASTSPPETLYHEIEDKESGKVRRLAYHKLPGSRRHGIIYIPGAGGHKGDRKPEGLHSFCQKHGFPYVRYDPSGLGESQGLKLSEANFSMRLEDAREMLLKVADGPQIVVCSSMGAWLTSLLVQEHPEKFAGILMVAPAINFHTRFEKKYVSELPPKVLKKYEEGGTVTYLPPDYGIFHFFSKAILDDLAQYALHQEPNTVPVSVPVRIIHGMKDKDADPQESLTHLHTLGTEDVQLTYLKHAGHMLDDDQSLEVIYDAILKLAAEVDKKATL